jgi:hypothetical protein
MRMKLPYVRTYFYPQLPRIHVDSSQLRCFSELHSSGDKQKNIGFNDMTYHYIFEDAISYASHWLIMCQVARLLAMLKKLTSCQDTFHNTLSYCAEHRINNHSIKLMTAQLWMDWLLANTRVTRDSFKCIVELNYTWIRIQNITLCPIRLFGNHYGMKIEHWVAR